MSETESDKTSSVSSPEEERSHRPSHEGVSEGVSEEAAEGVSEGFILKLLSGFHVGAEVALTPDTHVTIGRDESCDVILSDPSIAPQHGQLTIGKDGRAVIKGILSAEASSPETSPETFMRVAINGKPIDGEGALQQGDIITLGRLHLAYGAPETPWHQLTIPSFSDEASPPSEHGEAHGETASPSHDGEDASPSPIEGAVLTDHRDQRTERRRFSFTRTLVFICLPLGFAVVPLFFLLHGMPPMPSLPMMKATEEMTATTEDVAHGERMEEQDTSDHLPDRFHDRLHDTPHDIHAVHSAMSEAVSGAMSEAMPEGEPQHDGASSLSLAERVSMLLASMDGGRGHVTVQDSSHAVTIGGYVHTHHDLNVLRGFIEARIPDASVRSQLRYRVTSTQTLAMAIRSELE
ncbi:MAG: FHA domain-containing protein, partial [Alphaproteobacteria bacterium GM7ARS4]|nr:FHA domain-containing protein [Alphaproteobacteria bacterium GM7ARS4]